jgi:translation initiation factor 4G
MYHRIRPATADDAPFIAWVQQEASRSHLPFGFWDLAFPGPDEYRLRLVERIGCAEAKSFCHWSNFLVAEVDGEPAAGLSGYANPKAATGDLFIHAMAEALTAEGWNEARMGAMQERIAPFLTCIPTLPEEAWILEWVATRPAYRGKGLTRALLQAIVDVGRKRGHELFQIGVLIGNTPAQRAYEGAGFKVVDEVKHPSFEATFGVPGLRRLLRH